MVKPLDKLRQIIGGGIYNPTTNIFDEIDLDELAVELNVDREATARGKKNIPTSSAKDLDDIESKIVATLEAQRTKSHQTLTQQFKTYDERLGKYDSIAYPAKIQTTAIEACSNLYVEVHRGLDKLHDLRKSLVEEQASLDRFRKSHQRHDPARYPDSTVLYIAFVLVLLGVESAANGQFLATGDEGGLIGGVTLALVIAAANVGLGFCVGWRLLPCLLHRSMGIKFIGAFSLVCYLALMLLINFGAAHYRDAVLQVAAGTISDPGDVAYATFRADIFGVANLKSWAMLSMGIAFSIAAAFDGWYFDEPYPGYGKRWRRVSEVRTQYITEKDRLQGLLEDTKNDAMNGMDEAITDLSRRSEEIKSIAAGRRNILALCRQNMAYLQECANQVVTRYREKNKQARTAEAPNYWERRIILAPVDLPEIGSGDDKIWQSFETERKKAQAVLISKTQEIMAEYQKAIEKYHTIEQLSASDPSPILTTTTEKNHVA